MPCVAAIGQSGAREGPVLCAALAGGLGTVRPAGAHQVLGGELTKRAAADYCGCGLSSSSRNGSSDSPSHVGPRTLSTTGVCAAGPCQTAP